MAILRSFYREICLSVAGIAWDYQIDPPTKEAVVEGIIQLPEEMVGKPMRAETSKAKVSGQIKTPGKEQKPTADAD